MSLLGMLFNNKSILGAATGQLTEMFTKDGVKAIIVEYAPGIDDSPLPDFRISKCMQEVAIVPKTDYDRISETIKTHPHALTPEEFAEYQNLKNAKENGDNLG